jgi:hypothetical protein
MMLAVVPFGPAAAVHAQALPAAQASPISTGFTLPELGGSLNWAVTASGSLDWGYYGRSGPAFGTTLSGDLAYLSPSTYHPFSMVVSGGRTWGTSGEPSYEFANLGLSQLVNLKRWNFVFSDNVNYLPETATTNLSGVPGIGDLGVTPSQGSTPVQVGPDSGQGLLINYSPEVTNIVAASSQRQITGKSSLNASGSYSVLRFVDGPGSGGGFGLESDSVTGSGGFTYRLDARNTYGANYAYSSYIFLNNLSNGVPEPNFVSQTASFTYSRQVSRRLTVSVAAGPQWTSINFSQSSPNFTQSSPSLSVYADASANYSNVFGKMSANYVRSTNSGWGVIGGSLSDSASFAVTHTFALVWNASANVAWTRTASLPGPNITPYDFKTTVASFQVSRALARSLSSFLSYTVEDQTQASTVGTVDLFSGYNQIFAFGITYSPAAKRLGRH